MCNDGTSSILTISPVKESDQGLYKCKIKNDYGTVETEAQVKVEQPETHILIAFPDSIIVTAGTDLELICELSNEEASVNWLKNGQPLIENENVKFVEIGSKRQLVIKNAAIEDGANYICVTSDGNSRAKCKVNVKAPEAHVKYSPTDQTITELNQTAFVECELTSPTDDIKWLHNGKPINLDSTKYSISNDGLKYILKIDDFDGNSAGEYSIELPNGELSAPAKLQLKIPPKIEVQKSEFEIHAGKELSFNVQLSGFPTPTLDAILNGIPLKDLALIDTIDDENIQITIKSVKPENAGELKLKVENDSGEDLLAIPVKVIDVPQIPKNVQANLVNENTAEIQWSLNDKDETAPTTEYIIEQKSGDQTRWRQCGQVKHDEEPLLIVEDLPYDELILFRVLAVNEVGRGKPSKTVDLITLPKKEEQPDEEIAQIESALAERIEEEEKPTAKLKANAVELKWKASENVRLYAIERRKTGSGVWIQIAQTDRNWFVDRTITEPGAYQYRILAEFNTNEPKYTEPTNEVNVDKDNLGSKKTDSFENDENVNIIKEQESEELKPSAKLKSNGVELKWTAMENVRLYAIERRKTDDGVWIQIACTARNRYVDRTIIEPGCYQYRIVAKFIDGKQQVSSPSNEIDYDELIRQKLKEEEKELDENVNGDLKLDEHVNGDYKLDENVNGDLKLDENGDLKTKMKKKKLESEILKDNANEKAALNIDSSQFDDAFGSFASHKKPKMDEKEDIEDELEIMLPSKDRNLEIVESQSDSNKGNLYLKFRNFKSM